MTINIKEDGGIVGYKSIPPTNMKITSATFHQVFHKRSLVQKQLKLEQLKREFVSDLVRGTHLNHISFDEWMVNKLKGES